jgi:hypothetical protein
MIRIIKPIHYWLISCIALIAGFTFYSIYNDLIIIKFPFKKTLHPLSELNIQKKNVKLIYWHNNKWQTEEKELLNSDNTNTTITYLMTSWLNTLFDEHIISKNVEVQSVMLDASHNEVYISFDRNPFGKESSTYEKLMFIQGLLRTLQTNTTRIQHVRLLVHYKPIHDYHLDFSRPWPITGFIKE